MLMMKQQLNQAKGPVGVTAAGKGVRNRDARQWVFSPVRDYLLSSVTSCHGEEKKPQPVSDNVF